MQELALHLLDIIENSARADSKNICIEIVFDCPQNLLSIKVDDDGSGMDEETLTKAQDPFYTSKEARTKKVGLGIPLFKQNAQHCNGSFSMQSSLGEGTQLKATFEFNHIDRIPLGNVQDTLISCILGHPEIDFCLTLKTIENEGIIDFAFDTKSIKDEIGDIPITYPDVITFIEQSICEGIKNNKMEEL